MQIKAMEIVERIINITFSQGVLVNRASLTLNTLEGYCWIRPDPRIIGRTPEIPENSGKNPEKPKNSGKYRNLHVTN